ncbi:MAG: sugar transferase [Solirubrobacteraceae bacterium]
MGHPQTFPLGESTPLAAARPFKRAADVGASALLLVLAAPLLGVLALAVRLSSHGPVLHREPAIARDGRAVALLSFRTTVDGGCTEAHARLRAVVSRGSILTPFGRRLTRTRLHLIPRLVNVLKGEASLF